jgi:hypothetical protein
MFYAVWGFVAKQLRLTAGTDVQQQLVLQTKTDNEKTTPVS